MRLPLVSIFTITGLVWVTESSMAAGLRRRTSSEDMKAAIEQSLKETEEAEARDLGMTVRDYRSFMAETKAQADADGARRRDTSLIQAHEARTLRDARFASAETTAAARERTSHMAAVSASRDAAIVTGAMGIIPEGQESNPIWIRDNLDTLVANKAAYQLIVATNLSMDEKTMKEAEFGKGGGIFENGYRRAKLLRVISKLETTGGGAAATS